MTQNGRQISASADPTSDPGCPQRPVDRMHKIDRIDDHGNIRQHWTRDGRRTICGIEIGQRQPPCGNAPCKRCEKIIVRLSETAASDVDAMKETP